jgi:hypothetical protein
MRQRNRVRYPRNRDLRGKRWQMRQVAGKMWSPMSWLLGWLLRWLLCRRLDSAAGGRRCGGGRGGRRRRGRRGGGRAGDGRRAGRGVAGALAFSDQLSDAVDDQCDQDRNQEGPADERRGLAVPGAGLCFLVERFGGLERRGRRLRKGWLVSAHAVVGMLGRLVTEITRRAVTCHGTDGTDATCQPPLPSPVPGCQWLAGRQRYCPSMRRFGSCLDRREQTGPRFEVAAA